MPRAIAALIISGSAVTHVAWGSDSSGDIVIGCGVVAPAADREESAAADSADQALDYWIFSDDYCGWASAESLVAPYSLNPLATEPHPAVGFSRQGARPLVAAIVDRTLAGVARVNRRIGRNSAPPSQTRQRLKRLASSVPARKPIGVACRSW